MKVSIIIPVFNSEKFLNECINSVIDQPFNDYELILINDGSSDNSGHICEEYSSKNEKVKIIHQSNKGVSSARNIGLREAKGEWISFVDSDDWISKNYFEVFNNANPQSDIIFLNLKMYNNKTDYREVVFDKFELDRNNFLVNHHLHPHFFGPCGKFYKAEIIKKNELLFDESLYYGEDSLFNLEILKFVKLVSSYPKSFYNYRRYVDNSLSKNKPSYQKTLDLYQKCRHAMQEIPPKYYTPNISKIVDRVLMSLFEDKSIAEMERKAELKKLLNSEYKTISYIFRNSKVLKHLLSFSKKIDNINMLNHYLEVRYNKLSIF